MTAARKGRCSVWEGGIHLATTTLLKRHANEGETIAEAIRDCLDYGKNPEKTENGKYVSSYECDPATVAAEFLLAKASYKAITGREQKKEDDILCYQIRQSFLPGEITPKEANRIGYELAMRWTKGRHAFIVTTHTDKKHIHCHIYYNSTTLDCTRKFRNFWGSSFALRRLSDRLCLENGLSIVENPKPRSKGDYKNYGEWLQNRERPLNFQDKLRLAIDTALAKRPGDLAAFLSLMEQAGYEIKKVRGGGLSFRLAGQGQERFTRLKTLGADYTEEAIRERIEGRRTRAAKAPKRETGVSLLIDIENSIKAAQSKGYEQWAKIHNLKQAAKTMNFLTEHKIEQYADLVSRIEEMAAESGQAADALKDAEKRLADMAVLIKNVSTYQKTKPVYDAYRKARNREKYRAGQEQAIILHEAAARSLKAAGIAKLPNLAALQSEYEDLQAQKEASARALKAAGVGDKFPDLGKLREEYSRLSEEKNRLYAEYGSLRKRMREYDAVKQNIDSILQADRQPEREKGTERG